MDHSGDDDDWTADRVETRLIAAFRALPGHAVFSRDGVVRIVGEPEATEALAWVSRYVPDRGERLMLLTWARC